MRYSSVILDLAFSSCTSNCELLYESPLGDPPPILDAKVHIWKQGGNAKKYERQLDLGEEALDILKNRDMFIEPILPELKVLLFNCFRIYTCRFGSIASFSKSYERNY